jgi:hypothetical protein
VLSSASHRAPVSASLLRPSPPANSLVPHAHARARAPATNSFPHPRCHRSVPPSSIVVFVQLHVTPSPADALPYVAVLATDRISHSVCHLQPVCQLAASIAPPSPVAAASICKHGTLASERSREEPLVWLPHRQFAPESGNPNRS